ncbi:hypothetical protein [Spiroplasma endosymbiont of Asaphidion curtum]
MILDITIGKETETIRFKVKNIDIVRKSDEEILTFFNFVENSW